MQGVAAVGTNVAPGGELIERIYRSRMLKGDFQDMFVTSVLVMAKSVAVELARYASRRMLQSIYSRTRHDIGVK